jgi:hypothetical protein
MSNGRKRERRKEKVDYTSKMLTQAKSRLHDKYITNNVYNFLLATIDEILLRPPNILRSIKAVSIDRRVSSGRLSCQECSYLAADLFGKLKCCAHVLTNCIAVLQSLCSSKHVICWGRHVKRTLAAIL